MAGPLLIEPFAKQIISFKEAEEADITVLCGSFGSGKTSTACMWGIINMIQNPHQCLVLRKTYQELHDTVRPEFGNWIPKALIKRFPGSYPYDCELHNGGRFMFRHAKHGIEDLRGITAGSIIIDQGEDIEEDTFFYLLGRLREAGGAPRKVVITMNPNGHDWLWRMVRRGAETVVAPLTKSFEDEPDKEFITRGGVYRKKLEVEIEGVGKKVVKTALVETVASENPHLPDDFLARQVAFLDPQMIRRFVYLSWEETSGLVLWEFDPTIHIIPDDFKLPDAYYFGGMDHGENAPTTVYPWAYFWDPTKTTAKDRYFDTLRVVGPEYYVGGATIDEHARSIRRLIENTIPETQKNFTIYADPMIFELGSQKEGMRYSIASEYQRYGLKGRYFLTKARARRAQEKVTAFKALLAVEDNRKHLVTGEMGAPLVYFRESCGSLFAEIEAYKLKNIASAIRGVLTEDKIAKSPDHGLDACFYAAMAEHPNPPTKKKAPAPKWADYKLPSTGTNVGGWMGS